MLPVLFFVPLTQVLEIREHLVLLTAGSFFGALGFILNLNSFQYLFVGIANTVRQAVYISLAVLIGALILQEYLSWPQALLLILVVLGASLLTMTRVQRQGLKEENKGKGILLALLSGIGYSLSFFFFTQLSRETHPLVAAYFWEGLIGIFALLYLLILKSFGKYRTSIVLPRKTAIQISTLSLTTITGTTCYAYAVLYGPYALTAGLVTASVIVVALVSRFLLKENLTRVQLSLIAVIVLCMFLLRVVS
jgi:drug/metabolite transporter (DMT)-like permease